MLRFNSREALKEIDAVVEAIHRIVAERIATEIPPGPPPLSKGGIPGEEFDAHDPAMGGWQTDENGRVNG